MRYTQDDPDGIADLLVGRKVMKRTNDNVLLDDGKILKFVGNDGGCACDAGCYDLTALNGVDNVITRVELENAPDDEMGEYPGVYRILCTRTT